MKRSRTRWFFVVLGLSALVWLAVVFAATRRLGPWLVVDAPLAHGDVIFVTDGQTPKRELEGAALYLEGWAPRVARARPRELASDEVRRLAGEGTQQERSSRVLHHRGVPEAAIVRLQRVVDNTRDELEADFA